MTFSCSLSRKIASLWEDVTGVRERNVRNLYTYTNKCTHGKIFKGITSLFGWLAAFKGLCVMKRRIFLVHTPINLRAVLTSIWICKKGEQCIAMQREWRTIIRRCLHPNLHNQNTEKRYVAWQPQIFDTLNEKMATRDRCRGEQWRAVSK